LLGMIAECISEQTSMSCTQLSRFLEEIHTNTSEKSGKSALLLKHYMQFSTKWTISSLHSVHVKVPNITPTHLATDDLERLNTLGCISRINYQACLINNFLVVVV
jgi:hypothetical protein